MGETTVRAAEMAGWPREAPAAMSIEELPQLNAWPLISIVTPSLNQGEYLPDAFASVRNQHYPRVEHIVMDGGSNDGTVDFLKTQVSLSWISEPDDGQSDAVNKGFTRASGDIIGWLNADDYFEPGTLFRVASFLSAHPAIDIVYGDCYYLYENAAGRELRLVRGREFDLDALLNQGCYIPQPATFVRRSVFDVGGLNLNLRYAMDYDWWLRLARAGKRFGYLPLPLATFRITQTSKSGSDLARFWPEVRRVSRQHGGRYFSRLLVERIKGILAALCPPLYFGAKAFFYYFKRRNRIG